MKLVFKELKGHEVGIREAQVLALACSPRTHVTWSHPFHTPGLCRCSEFVSSLDGSSWPLVTWNAALLIETWSLCSGAWHQGAVFLKGMVDFTPAVYLPDPASGLVISFSPGKLAAFCSMYGQFELIELQAKNKATSCHELTSLTHEVDAACVVIKVSSGSVPWTSGLTSLPQRVVVRVKCVSTCYVL